MSLRLKRLEIQGFKSFANRTVFDLADGLTAVVGPNGSGKSNFSEAVRWAKPGMAYRPSRSRPTVRAMTSMATSDRPISSADTAAMAGELSNCTK